MSATKTAEPPVAKSSAVETFGVHSEVGRLRLVMVCRPGLAHQRLTPGNRAELLFDDVLWVHEAQKDHFDFVLKMRERGVEVIDLHDLLVETLAIPQARAWVLDRRITPNDVGPGTTPVLRPWLNELPATILAEYLIGGIAILDLPRSEQSAMLADAYSPTDFIVPPVPNTLFQRDPSCWIYGGVTCNPMYWPARKPETLLQRGVYKFHPRFGDASFKIWWGDSDECVRRRHARRRRRDADRQRRRAHRHGRAHVRQAVFQVARRSSSTRRADARHRLPDAEEPRGDAPRHGLHLLRPRSVHRVPRGRRPDPLLQRAAGRQRRRRGRHARGAGHLFDVVKEALGLKDARVVETGGNAWQAQREQWDDGNNVVAL